MAWSAWSMGRARVIRRRVIVPRRPRLTPRAPETGRGPRERGPRSVTRVDGPVSGLEVRVALLRALARAREVAAGEHIARASDAVQGEDAEHAVGAWIPGSEGAGVLVDREQLVAGDRRRAGVLPVLGAAVELHVSADVDVAADHADRLYVAVRAAQPF